MVCRKKMCLRFSQPERTNFTCIDSFSKLEKVASTVSHQFGETLPCDVGLNSKILLMQKPQMIQSCVADSVILSHCASWTVYAVLFCCPVWVCYSLVFSMFSHLQFIVFTVFQCLVPRNTRRGGLNLCADVTNRPNLSSIV